MKIVNYSDLTTNFGAKSNQVKILASIKLLVLLLTTIVVICPNSAYAIDLDQAKSQGLVGEQRNGYLGSVEQASSPDIRELINSINQKRRLKYEKIAKETGSTLPQVEMLAGKKALEKTAPGHFIQTPNGRWKRK
jgi:uncharacterized protein YdbL (DUF1318 family)